ncbi:bifunctional 2-polyprenyl-6-hydroxyphenol methylase/3-demethylubiquinol 3-O-methyltransferase UbiG [Cryobacterium sp. M96]|uniref:class I SAM-dependent methyltransferase n=1 Tax=Cryobacterium sp. M96 TaxID=2048295 RepID=UPI000CE2FCD6|nr:class I SAM-dependent methyltransferase [Cryobacterium sp. M96]
MDATEWDTRYRLAREAQAGLAGRLWSALPAQIVQDTVSPFPPGRALDLATGDGRNAIWLAGHGWTVTAVDFSAEAVGQAEAHAAEAGVSVDWQVGDATTWDPAGESFDLVTVMYLHLPEPALRAVLARAAGWLSPGGHLVALGHDQTNLATGAPGPGDPAILYSPELLRSCIDPASPGASRVVRCETIRRDLATDPEAPGDGGAATFALDTLLVVEV